MQAGRFLLVGLLNTAVSLACILLLMRGLAWDYRLANGAGYAAGLLNGFVLNRSWTFRDQGPWAPSLARWVGVAGACWGANLLLIMGLHDGLGADVDVAQLAGVAAYAGLSFLGARLVAFRSPAPPARAAA